MDVWKAEDALRTKMTFSKKNVLGKFQKILMKKNKNSKIIKNQEAKFRSRRKVSTKSFMYMTYNVTKKINLLVETVPEEFWWPNIFFS